MGRLILKINGFEIELEAADSKVAEELGKVIQKLSSEEFEKVLYLTMKLPHAKRKATKRESEEIATPTEKAEDEKEEDTFGEFLQRYDHKEQLTKKILVFALYRSESKQASFGKAEYFEAVEQITAVKKSDKGNWKNSIDVLKKGKLIPLSDDKFKISEKGKEECNKLMKEQGN